MAFTNLAHHIDIDMCCTSLCSDPQGRGGAAWTDKPRRGSRNLEGNLQGLLEPRESGTYVAPPVRRVHIPKAGSPNETRPRRDTHVLRTRYSNVRC